MEQWRMISRKYAVSLNWLLKISVLVMSYSYLYVHLHDKSAPVLQAIGINWNMESLAIAAFVVVLMPLNWSLEAIKWRQLINPMHPVSVLFSLKAVLSGLPYAVFTPQRLGEIPGRALQLPKGKRIKAGALTTLGSFAQNMATLVFGLTGFALLLPRINIFSVPITIAFVLITALFMGVLIAALFNYHALVQKVGCFRWLPDVWGQRLRGLKVHPAAAKTSLGYSLLRYTVFMFQYALLLKLFGVSIALPEALATIASIYLTMSIIPSFILSEIGIRGSVAIFYLRHFTDHLGGIVAAASALWFINLIIPALLGSYFVWKSQY